ncbi:hypothetical protein GXW82_10835 [Streptacidiphilus sp. 4-A2]|nr:hypothetical protein [Streptacidiphilus sp. 4-A2]
MPHTAKQGQTINMVMWYHQNSGLRMVLDGACLSMWNFSAPGTRQNKGVTVSWLSPVTHKWVPSTSVDDNGTWELDLSQTPTVIVASNYWAHIDVRITFSRSSYTGTWHVGPEPAGGSTYLAKNGSWLFLPTYDQSPQYTFSLNR